MPTYSIRAIVVTDPLTLRLLMAQLKREVKRRKAANISLISLESTRLDD